jgi:cytochrome b561
MKTAGRFGLVAIALHWLAAGAIVAAVILAWIVEDLERGGPKDLMLMWHKSVGLTIFAVMIVRLVWRLTHPAPPLPPQMSLPQRLAAGLTHIFLYAITLAMPVSGYLSVAARGRETLFYGLFMVPRWAPLDRALSLGMEKAHNYGQYALYVLVAAHVGAALYHHFVLRDGVLARMWPGATGSRSSAV